MKELNEFKMFCFEVYRQEPLLKRECLQVADWVIEGIQEKHYKNLGISKKELIDFGKEKLITYLKWARYFDEETE